MQSAELKGRKRADLRSRMPRHRGRGIRPLAGHPNRNPVLSRTLYDNRSFWQFDLDPPKPTSTESDRLGEILIAKLKKNI